MNTPEQISTQGKRTSPAPPGDVGESLPLKSDLSGAEIAQLAALEKTVMDGLKKTLTTGAALLVIREEKLYRSTHRRFADYCLERWQIEKSYANRIIAAARLARELASIGTICPLTESQLRPLAGLRWRLSTCHVLWPTMPVVSAWLSQHKPLRRSSRTYIFQLP
jgi:hypothetical protein